MNKREQYIQEVREGIEDIIRPVVKNYVLGYIHRLNQLEAELKRNLDPLVDKILSDPRIAILDPEQNYKADLKCVEFEYALGYSDCIEDIQRDNRVKVIPKEEYAGQ